MADTITVTGENLSEDPPAFNDGVHRSGEYADFTVKCCERTWQVHRAIICSRSSYFKRACDGGFKEAEQASISLEDDDPDLVYQMLMYLYTTLYPQSGIPPRVPQDAIFDAKVYAVADKYDLPDLKQKTRQAFLATWRGTWNFALLKDLVHTVYELTPDQDRGLRDEVIETVWNNRINWLPMKPMQELIAECQGLKEDILQRVYLTLTVQSKKK